MNYQLNQLQGGERSLKAQLKLPEAASEDYSGPVVPALYMKVSHYAPAKAYSVSVGRESVGAVFTSESFMLFDPSKGGNPMVGFEKKVSAPRYSAKKLQELYEEALVEFLNDENLEAALEWAKGAVAA